MSEVDERLRSLVAGKFGIDQASLAQDTSYVEDLGADSLDTVELVMLLEDQFHIDIPDEDALGLTTVGRTIEYLREVVTTEEAMGV